MAEQPASPDPILHDPQNDLRKRAMRRLIAAIVLIAAAVAALAFLSNYSTEKPAEPPKEIAATPPEKPVPTEAPPDEAPAPELPAEPPTEPAPPLAETPPPVEPPPPPQVAPEPSKAPVRPTAARPAPAPAPATAAPRERISPPPQPTPAERPVPPRSTERQPTLPLRQESPPKAYVVQLGVFTDYANAKQLQERLAQNGIKSYTETRLNVGPFQSKAEADQAMAKLRSMGISAVVAPTH